MKYLIKISANEAKYIRDHGQGHCVHMSSKTHKSSGKRYWMTSSPRAMKLLKEYKERELIEVHDGR